LQKNSTKTGRMGLIYYLIRYFKHLQSCSRSYTQTFNWRSFKPLKDEAQTAWFKDLVRTAL
jgi:hypothetical protein